MLHLNGASFMNMRPDSGDSSQWSDITEAIANRRRDTHKKQSTHLQNPFSDPKYEDEVIQLRSFEALNASRSEPAPDDFVSEHPSWASCPARRSQTARYLKPAFHDEDEEFTDSDVAMNHVDTDAAIGIPHAELRPGLQFPQPQVQNQNQNQNFSQRRSTHDPQSYTLASPRAAKLVTLQRVDPACLRASSIYEDDVEPRSSHAISITAASSLARGGGPGKRRPATLGFDRRTACGDLMASNSKSSSRASADPFRFDGDRYSPFLKPSAEREISRALYRDDSNLTATPNSPPTTDGTAHPRPSHTSQASQASQTEKHGQPGSFYDHAAIQST